MSHFVSCKMVVEKKEVDLVKVLQSAVVDGYQLVYMGLTAKEKFHRLIRELPLVMKTGGLLAEVDGLSGDAVVGPSGKDLLPKIPEAALIIGYISDNYDKKKKSLSFQPIETSLLFPVQNDSKSSKAAKRAREDESEDSEVIF